jgi:gamma-glutamyltranspeptidase/glutathione hydrolase
MAGIEAMHKRFGKLPFAQLFQPAMWYAENGVTVTPLRLISPFTENSWHELPKDDSSTVRPPTNILKRDLGPTAAGLSPCRGC